LRRPRCTPAVGYEAMQIGFNRIGSERDQRPALLLRQLVK
jgi:hypothetical protein